MLIATRGNDKLFLERESEGKRVGRIELEDGVVVNNVNVDSVLARGYWKQAPQPSSVKSLNIQRLPASQK
jgi:hypothetical protein